MESELLDDEMPASPSDSAMESLPSLGTDGTDPESPSGGEVADMDESRGLGGTLETMARRD
jgi:hypothetical protein